MVIVEVASDATRLATGVGAFDGDCVWIRELAGAPQRPRAGRVRGARRELDDTGRAVGRDRPQPGRVPAVADGAREPGTPRVRRREGAELGTGAAVLVGIRCQSREPGEDQSVLSHAGEPDRCAARVQPSLAAGTRHHGTGRVGCAVCGSSEASRIRGADERVQRAARADSSPSPSTSLRIAASWTSQEDLGASRSKSA